MKLKAAVHVCPAVCLAGQAALCMCPFSHGHSSFIDFCGLAIHGLKHKFASVLATACYGLHSVQELHVEGMLSNDCAEEHF